MNSNTQFMTTLFFKDSDNCLISKIITLNKKFK